jgi:acyl-CoA thioesterase-2
VTTPLRDLLALDPAGGDCFVARSSTSGARSFGGHLLAQAVVAATRTCGGDRLPHSVHATFVRPGTVGEPVLIDVERLRDGSSFGVRRVLVRQEGRVLVAATVSLHVGENGDDWQHDTAPASPTLPSESKPTPLDGFDVMSPYEVRAVNDWQRGRPLALHPYWVRLREKLPEDPLAHQAALLVVSDVGVSATAHRPGRPLRDQRSAVSLDHALWWHRPVRADQWVLVDAVATTNALGRGFVQGRILTQDGTLAASFVQEAVLREPGANRGRAEAAGGG